ncbi:hypothetical protein [Kibdelosporangium aridum]|uniref:Peptidase inhibitor family I36 n=1 Tax=Kibdelosporangium aridum TaxID=2030 RepID=A0A1W2FTY1_KIBAR|nr:hypothetical protein [Kibdelosporangium aridum]SMD25172.1 hypothetical protein SAMN05661093_08968 [Kibdelosporangium aridum]
MRSINKRRAGVVATVLLSSVLMVFSLTQPASAAVRSWAPWVDHNGSNCDWNDYGFVTVKTCLEEGHNGVEPTYRAILQIWNGKSTGVQMSAAVINMWAVPSPAVQIRDDGCLNSGLSGGYGATCYGTVATRSAVCHYKRTATHITANAAINIPAVSSSRLTQKSMPVYVGC